MYEIADILDMRDRSHDQWGWDNCIAAYTALQGRPGTLLVDFSYSSGLHLVNVTGPTAPGDAELQYPIEPTKDITTVDERHPVFYKPQGLRLSYARTASESRITELQKGTMMLWLSQIGSHTSRQFLLHKNSNADTSQFPIYGIGMGGSLSQALIFKVGNVNTVQNENYAQRWAHVACTFNTDGTVIFYVNGVIRVSATNTTLPLVYSNDNDQSFVAFNGDLGHSRAWADAWLDDFRLYNRPLDRKEIFALYNLGRGGLFNRERPKYFVIGGPPAITGSITEGIKAGETLSALQILSRVFSDGVLSGETLSAIQLINKSITEGVKSGDSLALNIVKLANIDAGIKASDNYTIQAVKDAVLNEGIVLSDDISARIVRLASVSEGVSVSDFIVSQITLNQLLSDTAVASENLVAQAIKIIAQNEGIKGGEQFSSNLIKLLALSEGTLQSDTFIAKFALISSVIEGAKTGDNWVGDLVSGVTQLIQGVDVGESFSTLATLLKNITEGSKAGDALSGIATLFKAITEGTKSGDLFTNKVSINKLLGEGFLAGDTWLLSFIDIEELLEAALTGDNWAVGQVITKSFVEGVKASDLIKGILGNYTLIYSSILFLASIQFSKLEFKAEGRYGDLPVIGYSKLEIKPSVKYNNLIITEN